MNSESPRTELEKSRPIVRSLAIELWPLADRSTWEAACRPGVRLDQLLPMANHLGHKGLKARSIVTSMSIGSPVARAFPIRSTVSVVVSVRSAAIPNDRANPTKSICGSSRSIPT